MESTKKCHKQTDLLRLQRSIYLPLHELQGCYSKPVKICKAVSLPNIQPRCAFVCVDNVWNMNREREKKVIEFCLPHNIKVKDGPQVISCKKEKQQEYTRQLKAVCRGVKYCWIPR